MGDRRRLAVDERRGTDDRAAVCLGHRLHPEADPEQRDLALARDRTASIETPAWSGSPGPGRHDDPAEVGGRVVREPLDPRPVDRVVPDDSHSAPAASRAWTRLKVKES